MGTDYTGTYNGNFSGNIDPNVAAGAGLAIFGGLMLFFLVIFLVFYIYMAVCLMKIAKKTNTNNGWFAWIPILNIILMLQIAKKPIWWILLFLIPLVNIVISILVWMAIAKALGHPEWLGILMIVPIANLIVPGYLAFSSSNTVSSPPPVQPIQPVV